MQKAVKLIIITAFLALGLAACQAEPQNESSLNADPIEEQIDADQTDNGSEVSNYIPGEWTTDYQLALNEATNSGKVILANFTGSDWCIWCKRLMSEVFSQTEFIDYAKDNLVLLKLDYPRSISQTDEEKKQNEELAQQFAIQGFPTIVLMDKDGVEISRTNYQEGGAANYVNHLQSLITE